jgi:hypothetical protein
MRQPNLLGSCKAVGLEDKVALQLQEGRPMPGGPARRARTLFHTLKKPRTQLSAPPDLCAMLPRQLHPPGRWPEAVSWHVPHLHHQSPGLRSNAPQEGQKHTPVAEPGVQLPSALSPVVATPRWLGGRLARCSCCCSGEVTTEVKGRAPGVGYKTLQL